jgi:hypothetical protein
MGCRERTGWTLGCAFLLVNLLIFLRVFYSFILTAYYVTTWRLVTYLERNLQQTTVPVYYSLLPGRN